MAARGATDESGPATKAEERRVPLLLAVVLAPVLNVEIVGGFGFVVRMWRIVNGPPPGQTRGRPTTAPASPAAASCAWRTNARVTSRAWWRGSTRRASARWRVALAR